MKQKKTIIIFAVVFLILIYLGIAGQTAWYFGIPLEDFFSAWGKAILHPGSLHITEVFWTWILYSFIAFILIVASYMVSIGNYLRNKEFGDARWGDYKKVNKHLDYGEKVILSKHLRMGLNGAAPPNGHNRTLNSIVIGGPGSGKTWNFVTPNLLQANCSYVVVDPAGDVLHNTAAFFIKQGYRIRVLNLIDMESSDCYNPWAYAKTPEELQILVDTYFRATDDPNAHTADPFWPEAAKALLNAIVMYLYETGDFINFHSISCMANYIEVEQDRISLLDEHFNELERQNPDSKACWFYSAFKKGATETRQSILQTFNTRLARTKSDAFERLTAQDCMELESLWGDEKQKTIIYLVIPTQNTTYNFLVSMLYMQIFEGINEYYPKHGKCKHHLRMVMDEAANITLPKDFDKVPATCRKYGYSVLLILQTLSQLKVMFPQNRWESVLAQMDTQIYLGNTESSCHEYFSKALDKRTIDYRTRSYGRGGRSNLNESVQKTGRELMRPGEIRQMDNSECLVLIRDELPIKDKKYDVRTHPNFGSTADGNTKNKYNHIPLREEKQQIYKTNIRLECKQIYNPEELPA